MFDPANSKRNEQQAGRLVQYLAHDNYPLSLGPLKVIIYHCKLEASFPSPLRTITMTTPDISTQYRRDSDIIATDMDGDTVMMSIERGEYYGIGGVGSRCWELLAEPMSVEALVKTICAEFDVDKATCQKDMQAFVDELLRLCLVQRID